jgi:hypothetical protein
MSTRDVFPELFWKLGIDFIYCPREYYIHVFIILDRLMDMGWVPTTAIALRYSMNDGTTSIYGRDLPSGVKVIITPYCCSVSGSDEAITKVKTFVKKVFLVCPNFMERIFKRMDTREWMEMVSLEVDL